MPRVLKGSCLAALVWVAIWGLPTASSAQPPDPLALVAQLAFPLVDVSLGGGARMRVRALDVWAEGNLAAVSAGPLVHLIALDDPIAPQAFTIELPAGDESWDVKLHNGLLYVGLQTSKDNAALAIYDVAQPQRPIALSRFSTPSVSGTHNLFVAGKVAFLVTVQSESPDDGVRNPLWLVDVSDPAAPRDLGAVADDSGAPLTRVHDLTVVGNRAYVAGWVNGFWIVDFQHLDDPAQLAYAVVAHHVYAPFLHTFNAPAPGTHNVWPSADGTLLWVTDEQIGEGVRVFDIQNLDDIRLLDFYHRAPNRLPHNVVVDGEFAYLSHYLDGLRVLKFSDGKIIEVASRNTVGAGDRSNPYRGAWGVFPLKDHVLVSDTFNGLLVFEKLGPLQPLPKGP